MIPQEKSEAVARGLREAFGVATFDEISPLTKGSATSVVFRIVVRGTPYLLKITLRPDDATARDECMRAAADAGLAPRIWHTNVDEKVLITDFVEARPLSVAEALVRIPATLRRLHALATFRDRAPHLNTTCTFLLRKGPASEGLVRKFRALDLLPKQECDELMAALDELTAACQPGEADMVSCHNDLFKPDNALFDGERVWLIDWEAAFRNDRYADLAVMANQLVRNDAEERAFLREYFGRDPDDRERARLYLMQQVSHVFYAMSFLFVASLASPVAISGPAPDFDDFQRRFWDGEFDLRAAERKIAFARSHQRRLGENFGSARWNEALRLVA